MNLWHYLVNGSDELFLPKDWLANTARLRAYEGYTRRQLQQGAVVTDVAGMQRRAFWEAVAAKRQPRPAKGNVTPFERVSER